MSAHRPGDRLWILGDGPERPFLEELSRVLELGGRVGWAGYRADFAGWLPAMRALVIPSRAEGFSRAALFGMAAGLPVIGSAVGGLPDPIQAEHTGFLVPPDDPAGLAAAMSRLAADPAGAAAMGRRGRRRTETEFSAPAVFQKTLAVLQKIATMGTIPNPVG